MKHLLFVFALLCLPAVAVQAQPRQAPAKGSISTVSAVSAPPTFTYKQPAAVKAGNTAGKTQTCGSGCSGPFNAGGLLGLLFRRPTKSDRAGDYLRRSRSK